MFSPPYNILRALLRGLILLGAEAIEVLSPQAELQHRELLHHSSVPFTTPHHTDSP